MLHRPNPLFKPFNAYEMHHFLNGSSGSLQIRRRTRGVASGGDQHEPQRSRLDARSRNGRSVRRSEIMWSMRSLIGWPTLTLTPGIVATGMMLNLEVL